METARALRLLPLILLALGCGGAGDDSIVLTESDGEPGIVFRQPVDAALLNSPDVEVRLEVRGLELSELIVDGVAAVEGGPGSYKAKIRLAEGPSLVVRALGTDTSGNFHESTIQVTVDMTPPAIRILEPAEGARISSPAVDVLVETPGEEPVSVRVDGTAAAALGGGRYVARIRLALAENVIEVEARDRASNVGLAKVAVFVDQRPPVLDDCPELGRYAWYGGNSGVTYSGGWDSSDWVELEVPHKKCGPHPLARLEPNPWGIFDVQGNVTEWVWDEYALYEPGNATDPVGLDRGGRRVVRGANYMSWALSSRAAFRAAELPGERRANIGVRVVRSVP